MEFKGRIKLMMLTTAALAGGFLCLTGAQVQAANYRKAVTKIAGNGNYAVYRHVSRKGPSGQFTTTKYFKHGQIQSKHSRATKRGEYWQIIVDGRTVGWVSEKFFVRNQISVAKHVALVANSSYAFPTRDAINFVTDSHGTAVNPAKVAVSQDYVSTKGTTVNYSYGLAKAAVQINVVKGKDASGSVKAQKGFHSVTTWNGGSKGSSRNWNKAHHYRSETRGNVYSANGLAFRTRLFEPRFVSLGYGQAGDPMGQVGVIPEGINVHDGLFTTSIFTSNNNQHGHLVTYNLKALRSRFAAQNLTTMKWSTFKSYAKNIKVSPYIKLGHGQSLGASASYIYVLANDNNYKNGPRSEEVMQIRKSDMQINQIWTIRIASNRYIHNATFVGDDTMYALFHNGGYNKYEYWKLTRSGDQWHARQIGATAGNFVTNSPVQGFAYGNGHFYIGYNDYLFKVASDGKAEKSYHFRTRRETEGLSFAGSRLYLGLAQRAELLSARQ